MWLRQGIKKRTSFAWTRCSGREPDVPLKVFSNLNEFATMCVYTCEDKTYCEHPCSWCISCYLRMRHFRRLIEHWRLSTQAEQRGGSGAPPSPLHTYSSKTLLNYPGKPLASATGSTSTSFGLCRQSTFSGAWAFRCPEKSQLLL